MKVLCAFIWWLSWWSICFRDWQKEIIRELFEIKEDGSYKHHTAYISSLKEMERQNLLSFGSLWIAWIWKQCSYHSSSCFKLWSSWSCFGSAKAMIQMVNYDCFVDVLERKIIVKDNPNAYILRVPCVAGQNDGLRPAPLGSLMRSTKWLATRKSY